MMSLKLAVALAVVAALSLPVVAAARQDALLAVYKKEAAAANPSFAGFSAERGKAFFLADHTGGKPDTPSCTTCHTKNPANVGQTRAGKAIDPMAVSANPDRFTDMAKAEKWFARNCSTVLGRECTPAEKGDFITFMMQL
jgi:cytochrome c peroxidase